MTRVAIVGLGLVGGSLARALTTRGWPVAGVDRAAVLRRARGVLATAATRVDAVEADLFVLAAPPDVNVELLEEVAVLHPDATITDVTSVKQPIVARARALRLTRFVGGHPMAGAERGGFARSEAGLFDNRPWLLTPTSRTSAAAVRAVRRMVRAAGARPIMIAPRDHDRAVASLSHLPQIVAWALHAAAMERGAPLALAGPAFGDMTRLAHSPRPMWAAILRQNAAEVRRALAAFERALRREVP